MLHTCPYAKTELLKPAIQFSTRDAPTSWNISSCNRKINKLKHILDYPILRIRKSHFYKELAWVASVSATESNVKVCPLIVKESVEIF